MDVGEYKGRVDFGIITIREDEFEAVLDRFPKVDVVEARRRYRIRRLPLTGGDAYTIAVVRCAEQGTSDALNTARDLLEDLDPAFLLVVGIAGGVPAYEFTLGDAIVCTRIADFSVEAVLRDHSREYALGGGPLHPDAAKLAADVRAMVRDGDLAGWNDRTSIGMDRPPVMMEEGRFYGDDDWKKDVRDKLEHHFGDKAARSPLVVTGPVASSDRLIKEAETLQVWLKIARQIQAVEMESAGVYKAAHGRVPFLAIRGISDVVGFKRHQDWTTYACHSAAAFTRALLLTKPVSPRAHGGTSKPEPTERERESMPSMHGPFGSDPSPVEHDQNQKKRPQDDQLTTKNLRGAWFAEPEGLTVFLAAASNLGKDYKVTAHSPHMVYDHGFMLTILSTDFVILPLSLPGLGSLWFLEQLANRTGSPARIILRSRTDADPSALSYLFDEVFRPESSLLPVFEAIERASTREKDPGKTGELIRRVLETSSHLQLKNGGIAPRLAMVRRGPRMESTPSPPALHEFTIDPPPTAPGPPPAPSSNLGTSAPKHSEEPAQFLTEDLELEQAFATWMLKHLGFTAKEHGPRISGDTLTYRVPVHAVCRSPGWRLVLIIASTFAIISVVFMAGGSGDNLANVAEAVHGATGIMAHTTARGICLLLVSAFAVAYIGWRRAAVHAWVECRSLEKITRDHILILHGYADDVKQRGQAQWKPRRVMMVGGSGFTDDALRMAGSKDIECYERDGEGFKRAYPKFDESI
jgi:nucleoside phosphorylase